MDYQNVLIGAVGTIEVGTVFKRADVYQYLVKTGYADRTARNALTPSHDGGMVNVLLKNGAIKKHGPLGYVVVDQAVISKPVKKARSVMYEGCPKPGWKELGVMSDEGVHEVDWMLCGQNYAKGAWNLKLYAAGRVPNKANFWIGYRDGRIWGRDATTLKEHHPDLYENIANDMAEICADE